MDLTEIGKATLEELREAQALTDAALDLATGEAMTEPTVWLHDDDQIGYHDRSCRCVDHCGNCLASLSGIRRDQQLLIDQGKLDRKDKLSPRRRYCSDYCQGRAARERALDRHLARGGQP